MTADEERQYLCDLIMSASEWRLSEGDERDTLRLEIQDRLRRLNGVETEDENGYVQSEPVEVSPVLTQDDYKALEAAKVNEHLDEHIAPPEKMWRKQWKWKNDKVRCQENGKAVWRPLCQCHKEKLFPDNPKSKKFRWVWDGPQDKKKQEEEAMWAEHEAGNAE